MSAPTIKPLTLWGGVLGPNPSKVSMILDSLSIPWEAQYIAMADIKKPEYEKLNPNGRLPTIIDPNTGVKLWETGAIIEYLVEEYDKEHKLSFERGTKEYYEMKQWLFFQASGQGPYFGQAWWFKLLATEKVPSAIDRYMNEVRRVSKVLDSWLSTHTYLVGEKCSVADIAFVSWQVGIAKITEGVFDPKEEYPHLTAWLERLEARPEIAAVQKEKAERMAKIQRERAGGK